MAPALRAVRLARLGTAMTMLIMPIRPTPPTRPKKLWPTFKLANWVLSINGARPCTAQRRLERKVFVQVVGTFQLMMNSPLWNERFALLALAPRISPLTRPRLAGAGLMKVPNFPQKHLMAPTLPVSPLI